MLKPKAYIGVDPGASGHLCLLAPDSPQTIEFCAYAEPPKYILDWLSYMSKKYDIVVIMIEDVHSIHNMSAKSNFSFGFNLGAVTAICKASGLGVDKVAPKVWQKAIGIKPKDPSIKKSVGNIAQSLYPAAQIHGPKGGLLDGKSDALMIAHYTFKTYTK